MFVCTSSLMSKAIMQWTQDAYTHVAISLDGEEFYSFARRYAYTPLPAGLTKETMSKGFYKRKPNTPCVAYRIQVNDFQYSQLKTKLEKMFAKRFRYKYNLIGVAFCNHSILLQRKNYRFCSEFVSELLRDSQVIQLQKQPQHIRPMELTKLADCEKIYEGCTSDYQAESYDGEK